MGSFFWSFSGFLALFSLILHGFYVYSQFGVKDIPNERSMHETPTKKSGGMIFIPIFIVACLCYTIFFSSKLDLPMSPNSGVPFVSKAEINFLFIVLVGTCLMMFLGFFDDIYQLSPKLRLFVELAVLISFVFLTSPNIKLFEWEIGNNWYLKLALVFLLVFAINLVNFMDGMDFYVIGTFWITSMGIPILFKDAFLTSGFLLFTIVLLLSSLFGFVFFNLPKARLFMGDSGSLALGFLICCLPFFPFPKSESTDLDLSNYFYLFPYFWVDGIWTIFRRLVQGKDIFQAHREHLYQRLTESRFGKLGTLILFLLLNLIVVIIFSIMIYFQFTRFFSFLISLVFVLVSYFFFWSFVPRKNLARSSLL